MTEDDWKLKVQLDEIHLEYYEIQDIDTLRKKLIEDIHNELKPILKKYIKDENYLDEFLEGWFDIINKRFGVDED